MITSARSLFAMNVRPTAGRLARGAAVVVLGLLPFAAGCTKVQTQGDGSSYLIIDALEPAPVRRRRRFRAPSSRTCSRRAASSRTAGRSSSGSP